MPIFTPAALQRIFRHTRGVPRLINALGDQALLTGYVNDEKTIQPGLIDEVARELPALG